MRKPQNQNNKLLAVLTPPPPPPFFSCLVEETIEVDVHTLPALGVHQDVLSVPIPQPDNVSHARPNGRRPATFFLFLFFKQKTKKKKRGQIVTPR